MKDLSKKELLETAKKLKIKNYSRLSKDDLIKALEKSQGKGKVKKAKEAKAEKAAPKAAPKKETKKKLALPKPKARKAKMDKIDINDQKYVSEGYVNSGNSEVYL